MGIGQKFLATTAVGLATACSLNSSIASSTTAAQLKEAAKEDATAYDASQSPTQNTDTASLKRSHEWDRLNKLGRRYEERGDYSKAEPLFVRCLRLSNSHEQRAISCDNLASIYRSRAKLQQALPWLKKALELREQAEGVNGSGVETSLNNLSDLYHDMGDLTQAVELTKRAVAIARLERDKGVRTANLPNNLNSLALLYKEQGDREDTESLFKQVVDLQSGDPNANPGDYANNLNNLARLYREDGRFEAAEPLYKQSLQLREKTFGGKSAQVGATLRNYAIVLRALNRDSEAANMDRRASAIEDKR